MAEKTASQVHNIPFNPTIAQDAWKKMSDDHFARIASFQEEVAKFETRSLEQARAAIDEMARLAKETLGYAGQLQAEWRRLGMEATRRTYDLFGARS